MLKEAVYGGLTAVAVIADCYQEHDIHLLIVNKLRVESREQYCLHRNNETSFGEANF